MNSMRKVVVVVLVVAGLGGIAGFVITKRQARPEMGKAQRQPALAQARNEPHPAAPSMVAPQGAAEVPPSEQPRLAPESVPLAEPVMPPGKTQNQAVRANPPAKEPVKDPLAREALALVGADPEAEQYWFAAINNPNLSNHERQDLIEDLNEEGLSDPNNPSLQDLPLIASRILLIEQLAPDAMDQVNADAFQEAYKDLLNLADLALGGGEPVR